MLVTSSSITEAEKIANRFKRFEGSQVPAATVPVPVPAPVPVPTWRGVPRQQKVNATFLQKSLQPSLSTNSLLPPHQQQPPVVVPAISEVQEPVAVVEEVLDNAPPGPFTQTQENIEQELEEGEEPTVE